MFLTIFTPVYNRSKYMKRLFDSICNQNNKDFEWIIINDGSTDDTEKVIRNLIKNHKTNISIKFISKKNGGKQRAINDAVKIAKGKYFFIVDSDDKLTPDATQLVRKWCKEIDQLPDFNRYAGVSGLCETPSGELLSGTGDGRKSIDASNLDRHKYNLDGDMAEVYKTSILKKYPFKEFRGENFISEGTVWNQIAADGYILRWHMEPIYIGEYLPDGLTQNSVSRDIKNFKGLTYATKMDLKLMGIKLKIHFLNYYVKIGRKKGLSWKKISKLISVPKGVLIVQYYTYIAIRKMLNKPPL